MAEKTPDRRAGMLARAWENPQGSLRTFVNRELNIYNVQYQAQEDLAQRVLAQGETLSAPNPHFPGNVSPLKMSPHAAAEFLESGGGIGRLNFNAIANYGGAALAGAAGYHFLKSSEYDYNPGAGERLANIAGGVGYGVGQLGFDLLTSSVIATPYQAAVGLAGAGGIRAAAGMLGKAVFSPMGLPVMAAQMSAGMVHLSYQLLEGKRQEGGYRRRNWYKPNLAPLYHEGALSGRRSGVQSIMGSSSYIGNEARIMARRGY